MKARIKATGEIVDLAPYTRVCEDFAKGRSWLVEELCDADDDPDYWTRLEHTYAGMAMQGILTNPVGFGDLRARNEGMDLSKVVAEIAAVYAHTLVEKYKEKEK